MQLEQINTPTRLIRRYFSSSSENSNTAKSTSRFIGPYRFTDEQIDHITAAVTDRQLGDSESCRIFILAVEYEIASLGAAQEQTAHLQTEDPTLKKLQKTARKLHRQLSQLNQNQLATIGQNLAEADTYSREYKQPYFTALTQELERLSQISPADIETETTVQAYSDETSSRFIALLANAFSECFELTVNSSGPQFFFDILDLILTETNLSIRHDSAFIQQTLSDYQPD